MEEGTADHHDAPSIRLIHDFVSLFLDTVYLSTFFVIRFFHSHRCE